MPRFVAAALVALLSFGSPALAAAMPAPAEAVTRATLDNGLRVVIVRDPLAPVVTEVMNYLVGGADTPRGFPGMAHAEEHMVAGRSTTTLDENQVATMTALLGGDDDADTQESVTQYYTSLPSAYLAIALNIEAARMRGPLDSQAQWAQERGAIEQEVSRDLSGASYRYFEAATSALFAGTPYDHTPLGTRASFDRTTGPMLKAFFKSWYAPNNAILVIAGAVDAAATLAQVRAIFESIPRRAVPQHRAVALAPLRGRTIRDVSDSPLPAAELGYRLPGFESADFAAAEIAVDVLQSERGALSALQAEGKVLGASVDYEPYPAAGLAFLSVTAAPGDDVAAALQLAGATIEEYQKNGVPDDLVEAAKRREVAQELYSRNSIEGLAMDWSEALAIEGARSPDDIVAQLQRVSAADVQRALRTYFVRDTAFVGILTPKPGAEVSGETSLAIRDTFTAAPAKPVTLPSWAAALRSVPPVPKSNVDPSDEALPNGIRLIVQPESVSPTVTVRGEIRNNPDLEQPPGKDGVADILAGMFQYGTTTYDRVQFARELDAIAADESAGTSFGLNVPAEGFQRGLQLLADNELHPALRSDAFATVAHQEGQTLAGVMTSPDYLASRALTAALFPADDPALREATPQSVAGVTLDDVRAYHAKTFRPDLTTIVVAGDVTREEARAAVEAAFGAWTAQGPAPQTTLPPVPRSAPSVHAVLAPQRTQSSVTLAEEIGLTRGDPDYYAVELGDLVLGGAFYADRFTRDLRQQNGLVYSVSAALQASRTRGAYVVSYGCDPANVGRARSIVDRDLHVLGETPPSNGEMDQAKTQLIRDLDLAESSVDAIAGGLAARSLGELPLDEPTRRARITVALTAEQVRAAFAKWIDPAHFAQVDEGPASP